MNALFLNDSTTDYKQGIIRKQLEEGRFLLLVENNVYYYPKHCIFGRLRPQEALIDSVARFINTPGSSFVMGLWDSKISKYNGQDVDNLMLSLLGSFVNDILEPRKLIVDDFSKLLPSVQERILTIMDNSRIYDTKTFIAVDEEKVTEDLIMKCDLLYIPKPKKQLSKMVQSLLSNEELRILETMGEWDVMIKRKGFEGESINFGREEIE